MGYPEIIREIKNVLMGFRFNFYIKFEVFNNPLLIVAI